MKGLALLNILVILIVIVKVNDATESMAERAMEKLGKVAVVTGQKAKSLFNAFLKGAQKQKNKSKKKKPRKYTKAVEERTGETSVYETSMNGVAGTVHSEASRMQQA
ncbi:uncharacterized protein LOC142768412 isoform X1 [Rhipicephalus microplus]|uniref:uncharacterized protein LOC142768412 isoform X1 n=1 Tax=Rhipicephalus microplus TaxID=6941 RepID=UPI003F6CAAD9